MNNVTNNLLKNIRLLAREESINIAMIFITIPNNPTVHNKTPSIQYLNMDTTYLSISVKHGQFDSDETFILENSS